MTKIAKVANKLDWTYDFVSGMGLLIVAGSHRRPGTCACVNVGREEDKDRFGIDRESGRLRLSFKESSVNTMIAALPDVWKRSAGLASGETKGFLLWYWLTKRMRRSDGLRSVENRDKHKNEEVC